MAAKRTAPKSARKAPARKSASSARRTGKSRPATTRKRAGAVVALTSARQIQAKYDAAQTTADNRNHWANADGLSPSAANTPAVRKVLRDRARLEAANNCYARGILSTLANDTVGMGPRLQMLTDAADLNAFIERKFAAWADAANFAAKLRLMCLAKRQDGEAFALIGGNKGLRHPVKIDLALFEADMCANPIWNYDSAADGIEFDDNDNPARYFILDEHPGGTTGFGAQKGKWIDAKHIIHWFRTDRPGQVRGLPEIMPALPLFAQLRRYTLAVISAAESAADIALFMKTTMPPSGEAQSVEPMSEMDIVPNSAVFAPEGWEATQVKAEQPATTYKEFKAEILNEIARCFDMPFNIAACNSASYNYASGRLDHQTYFRALRVEQSHAEIVVLDRLLSEWLREARYIYSEARGIAVDAPHQWFWEGREHVDPLKEAGAQGERLSNHTTTLAAEYAKAGLDWEDALRQRSKELALMKQLGLPSPDARPATPGSQDKGAPDEEAQ